jgi:hypothetical protein
MTQVQPSPACRRRDALLGTVRVALSVAMAGTVIVGVGQMVAIPLVMLWHESVVSWLSRHAGTALPGELPFVMCGLMALIVATAALAFLFLRYLRRIIDTVGEGDPFIPENSVRLRWMAWLVVAIELLAIPAGIQAGWISYVAHVQYADIGFSFGGAMLALILFVLARVFHKGAEMRDELEGTV